MTRIGNQKMQIKPQVWWHTLILALRIGKITVRPTQREVNLGGLHSETFLFKVEILKFLRPGEDYLN